jgi:hypothetical protein
MRAIGGNRRFSLRRAVASQALLLALAASAMAAAAQGFGDPMAPPPTMLPDPPAGAAAPASAAPPAPGLQGVIRGPHRAYALIDGEIVREGAAFSDERRLDAVDSDSAVVRAEGERKTLSLHPSIEKKPAQRK